MICKQKCLRSVSHLGLLSICLVVIFSMLNVAAVVAEDPGMNTKKSALAGQVSLVGVAEISGEAIDLSGLSQTLVPEMGTTDDEISPGAKFTNDMLGGISAIAWAGEGDLYWFLPDRGPLDGAVDWSCRVHKVRITVGGSSKVTTELVETVLLKDDRNMVFTGLASAYEETETRTRRLDPEGIRVGADGNLFVSDEYGPRLIEFKPTGDMVREFEIPSRYKIDNPGVSKATENPINQSGRQCNRGMEGLAISTDGKRLFGLMQSPLLQDSFRQQLIDKPAGLNCRMPVFDMKGDWRGEYLYRLDSVSNKLNEILAFDRNQFITIERDGNVGTEAQYKKLMLIAIDEASDTCDQEEMPATEQPEGIKGVAKEVLVDLLDPKWNLAGQRMPEKIESLAFGPDFPNGDRLLIVASDNDFVSENATQLFVFRIPQALPKVSALSTKSAASSN